MTLQSKIVILENYSLFSSGIRSILEQVEEFEVIDEARNLDELLHHVITKTPDVIVLDLLHCQNAGLDTLRRLKRVLGGIPVLLITSYDFADCFTEHILLGVKGFIFSNTTSAELIKAVKKLTRGGEYFPNQVTKIYKQVHDLYLKGKKILFKKKNLTERESTILRCLSLGLSHKEIGEKLYISPRTVETHKRNILSKLNLTTSADLIKYAVHHQMALE
jgi:DNA-binding NarL/FixJ family response regulator